MARIKIEEVPHKCEICHIDLERMPNEPTFNFNKRITCDPSTGRKCRAEMRKIAGMKSHGVIASVMPEPKRCTICGDIIPYGKDTAHRYSSRVICKVKDKPSCFSIFTQKIGKKSAEVKEKKRKAGIAPKVSVTPEPAFVPVPIPTTEEIRRRELIAHNTKRILPECVARMVYIDDSVIKTIYISCSVARSMNQQVTPPTGPRRDILPHFHRMECTV